MGVLHLAGLLQDLRCDASVLSDGRVGVDEVALGKVWAVALEDLADGAVGDRPVQLEGGGVGLCAGFAHATALVGVEGGVEDLNDQAALRSIVEVNGAVLDGEVLASYRETGGDLLEDESLVLGHDEWCGLDELLR